MPPSGVGSGILGCRWGAVEDSGGGTLRAPCSSFPAPPSLPCSSKQHSSGGRCVGAPVLLCSVSRTQFTFFPPPEGDGTMWLLEGTAGAVSLPCSVAFRRRSLHSPPAPASCSQETRNHVASAGFGSSLAVQILFSAGLQGDGEQLPTAPCPKHLSCPAHPWVLL